MHFLTLQDCPICLKKVKLLKKHIRRCQQKSLKLPCDECNKTFSNSSALKRHVEQVHRQIKNHHCDICNYKTYTDFNLRIHISKMHTRENLERFCPVCQIKTMVLENHLKTYHFEYYQELKKEKQSDVGLEKLDQPPRRAPPNNFNGGV